MSERIAGAQKLIEDAKLNLSMVGFYAGSLRVATVNKARQKSTAHIEAHIEALMRQTNEAFERMGRVQSELLELQASASKAPATIQDVAAQMNKAVSVYNQGGAR